MSVRRVFAVPLLAILLVASANAQNVARKVISFDPDWRFLKDDAQGAEAPSFNDAQWRKLDVPHDWSIEGPYAANAPTRGSGGSLPAGIGWYRKTFTLPATDAQKRVFIEFDGVMANSEVWINGKSLGKRPFGYISFRYDMTGNLNFGEGKTNVLAVRADNASQPASRWYAGAGIYRHVRLVVADPVHIDQWGTFVTTPKVAADAATVQINATIINQSDAARDVSIQTTLIGPDGMRTESTVTAPRNIPAGQTIDIGQEIVVPRPALWDVDKPNMYRAITSVRSGSTTLDDDVVPFGIRNAEFKTENGFSLNGKNMKILGVCLHADGGAFGMAVPLGVWEHRFKALKEMGVNGIRTAHNPPAPDFLDLCDRMGFLVMDETFDCWTRGKNTYDYHLYFNEWNLIDTRDMVMRDRNHPSIVLYSTGNEIHDTPQEELALRLLKPMVETMHKYDPTRAVTQALFRPNVSHDYTNGLADMLDVIGTNYRDTELIQAWKDKPGRKIIGTEQQHGLDTWLNLRDNPQHSGQFLWAGIDYLGEVVWPATTYFNGLLDRTGEIKPVGYQRQSWWSTKPVVTIVRAMAPPGGAGRGGRGGGGAAGAAGGNLFRNWTQRDEADAQGNIQVFSNCEEVELFLNDKSLEMKTKPADDSPRAWQVPFAAGVIKAVARNGGKVVATDELRSAAAPAKIVLTAERNTLAPSWDDVSFITAKVVDANGVMHPYAEHLITFKVEGPGVVAAVDNGDRVSHEIYQQSAYKAFQGRMFGMIKATAATGQIKVSASADGLEGASITIQAVAAK